MKSTMRSIGKILFTVFIILYAVLAIFVTVCMITFNDQRVSEFGNLSIVIANSDMGDDYKKGDLLFLNKGNDNGASVSAGDFVFFYNPAEQYAINYAEVTDVIDSNGHYTFVVGNDYNIYYDYYIGREPFVIPACGTILKVLESQIGFLALIILPTMVAVVFEIYAIILEILDLKKEA